MNITKDFQDYINIVKSTITSKFVLKCEKYGPIDKCARLLRQLTEIDRNIVTMSAMSKKSSPFNDIDFSNISGNIKKSLSDVEEQLKLIEIKDLKNLICSNYEKKTIYNTLELLKTRLQNLNLKFRKFLQNQSEFIKEKIKRINNLSGAHVATLGNKKSHNEYIYTSIPNDEDDILDIDVSLQSQSTMSISGNKNQYFQDRSSAVQSIEKTLGDLSSMFSRLGQLVYEQRSMIEKIDNNTDISLHNIELGERELIKIRKDVSSNRGLIIKIFLILIFTSVVYIIFLS